MATWFIATFIPAFIGITITTLVSKWFKTSVISSFAFGIFLFFFVDTIEGSANLDVVSGFEGGIAQFLLVLLFVVGLIFFFVTSSRGFKDGSQDSLIVPLLISVAIGIHGLGEGAAFGSTLSHTTSSDLIEAFGGIDAAISYLLHKMLEPVMIAACYVTLRSRSSISRLFGDMVVLSLVFSLTSLVGAVSGYFLNYDATYLFALGTGASILPAALIARNFTTGIIEPKEAFKISVALMLGLLAIYIAALFHS
jgi:hypothetical protein